MELRQLTYFVAVAEQLHFRRAADILHVAQPALSRQIHNLEREVGAKLFERSKHKVELTDVGQSLLARARIILMESKRAIADAQAMQNGEAGTLIVGFVSSATIDVLPSFLRTIRHQLPRVETELMPLGSGEQIEALGRSAIDIGFLHARLNDPELESVIMTRERLMLAIPASNLLARKSKVNLNEVANQTLFVPARHSSSGYFEHSSTAFQNAGTQPRRLCHTSLLSGLLQVGAGLGVSLVPESFRHIHVRGVAYRSPVPVPAPIDLLAVWRRDNQSPVLRRVIASVKSASARLRIRPLS